MTITIGVLALLAWILGLFFHLKKYERTTEEELTKELEKDPHEDGFI